MSQPQVSQARVRQTQAEQMQAEQTDTQRPQAQTQRKKRGVWLVLARRRYDESLHQVGTVTADDAQMAALFARSIYDEHPWIEMVVAPREAITVVIPS